MDLSTTHLKFKFDSDKKHYEGEIEFFDEIVVEVSQHPNPGWRLRSTGQPLHQGLALAPLIVPTQACSIFLEPRINNW